MTGRRMPRWRWPITREPAIPTSRIREPGVETIVLQDGRWVLAYNDTETPRNRLALACWDDEDGSWNWKRVRNSLSTGDAE